VVTGEYVYDGDGNRVKAIVYGTNKTTTTFYIGNYYEKIDEKIDDDTTTTIKKYYYAGGVRVAMSEKINEGLEYSRYFVTDHLGSTTKLINTNGTEYSETDYLAWGIDDPTPADIGTSFKYTGQRQAEAGLYFYNARWYDPELGRFIQADTIIPEPGNPMAWDRYA
jgi:RHS repeat-associated protein